MTSGKFKSVAVDSIIVERSERQRRTVENIQELAWSIQACGLINPVVINPNNKLITGERRLTAVKSLGWTHIPVQYTTDLEPDELHLIELEENIRRQALSWQDECLAIKSYHEMQKRKHEKWSIEKTADALASTGGMVSRRIEVAEEIEAGNEAVITADKYSVAQNLTKRSRERARTSNITAAKAAMATTLDETPPETFAQASDKAAPFINKSFREWAQDYSGSKFNLIHCDFPYGIEADNQKQGSNVAIHGSYSDTLSIYQYLLGDLANAMDNIVAESAHLIFWFSMIHHKYTLMALEEMGWKVNPFPLVWHKSCNTGLLPDPDRGPRRTYETAFFASRGDRKVVRAVANSVSANVDRDKIHMSQKPKTVLRHFMRMVCDEHSSVLDPTCGSGNAIIVAEELGAANALGIEIDAEFYNRAKENFHDSKV